MGNFFNDNRYGDLEKRICVLEDKVMALVGVPCKRTGGGNRRSVVEVPKGWVYPEQFCKRYKFISSVSLLRIIRGDGDFFQHRILDINGKIWMDPVDVSVYFESSGKLSTRLMNQYHNWRECSSDVGVLARQAKERMSVVRGQLNSDSISKEAL